jgi:hypothetical protein
VRPHYLLLASCLSCATPEHERIFLSTESLLLENSVLKPTNRVGAAVLPLHRFTLAPYSEFELFFLRGRAEDDLRWQLGVQYSVLLALGDEHALDCCDLDNEEAQLGLLSQFRWDERWGGSLSFDHLVGHRGVDGAFTAHRDAVRDSLRFGGTYHWADDGAAELAARVFFRDSPEDRLVSLQAGLVETFAKLRVELGLQAGNGAPSFESARAKVSYWVPGQRALRVVHATAAWSAWWNGWMPKDLAAARTKGNAKRCARRKSRSPILRG